MLTYVSNSTYFCDKYLLRNASKKILNQSRFDEPYGYFYRYKGVFNHKNVVGFCKSFRITDSYTVVRNEIIFFNPLFIDDILSFFHSDFSVLSCNLVAMSRPSTRLYCTCIALFLHPYIIMTMKYFFFFVL